MRLLTAGLVLLAPLVAMPVAPADAQGRPEGNTGSGAAMGEAQRNATGQPAPGGAVAPGQQPTTSPRPPGSADADRRDRPEGNLGSGAAMTGSQRNSTGLPSSGGGATVPAPTTTSPRQ
jgi:hypothetical protein